MTTQERAEKMVAERLGIRVTDTKPGVCQVDGTEERVTFHGPYTAGVMISLWSEAVRLQAELLEKENKATV